jgi:hypothetical protein
MIRGLLTKELRQHGLTFLFLFLVLLGALVLIAGNSVLRRATGGGFSAVLLLHTMYVPLACLVLGQVLIATEFRQKTQLFLEGLPLPRWRMLAVKFGLGLALLIGSVGSAIFVAWWTARNSEAMTPRFATLVALKSAGWVWFLYTLCFAHAFLGRYRVALALTILFVFFTLKGSAVPVGQFGPFALIDDRFAFERHILPVEALVTTGLLGLGLAALGFTLGLVRDASVASLLAEKMSSREKVFITFLVAAALMLGVFLFERYRTATPVRMPGATEAQHSVVRVMASAAVDAPSREETATIERVAKRAADELGALADYLGCKSFPPVFIVHRRDLAAGEWSNGDLKASQGVLVRANLTAAPFDEVSLHRWLVRETLLAHTGGLAGRERNAWALDGLAWWWPQRAEAAAAGEPFAAWLPEAKRAMPVDFSPRDLGRWLSLEKDAGESRARALAASGLGVLAQRHGAEARQRFLSAMFGAERPADSRGWIADVIRPRSRRFYAATGVREKDFVVEWRAALNEPPAR